MMSITPHPVLFQVGGFPVTAHGLMFALGAETGCLFLYWLARRRNLPTGSLADKCLLVFVAGLVAARVGFFIIYPGEYRSVWQVLRIWEGGLVSFFGIAGGLAAAYALFPTRRREWLGLLGVAALAAWGIGRIGNFLAGDSWGILSPYWSLTYGRVPIQLFESVLCLALAVFWGRRLGTPRLLAWALLSYVAVRFLVDFWRDETVWQGLRVSQWACLALAVPLAGYLYARHVRR